jgi:hypothetical protein
MRVVKIEWQSGDAWCAANLDMMSRVIDGSFELTACEGRLMPLALKPLDHPRLPGELGEHGRPQRDIQRRLRSLHRLAQKIFTGHGPQIVP